VLGHADFAKNNSLFKRSQEQVGYKIVEQAAAHARQIGTAVEQYGQNRVEQVLDAALSLEAHIDSIQLLRRDRYASYVDAARPVQESGFQKRFDNLPGGAPEAEAPLERTRAPIPPTPERDLLWFIAEYAPELEEWERDIFRAVREESFYFHPVFACQIMNEGWASYWHARLLREADFLPQNEYLDALKTHSDVVRPHAADQQASLATNPYHLGFSIWESIVAEHGIKRAFQIRAEDDDFSFVRNHLTEELAEELKLFRYERSADGGVKVLDHDIHALRETVLAPKYNFGAPAVLAKHVGQDGALTLVHEHDTDGRGLDLERAERVLDYIHKVWRRPIRLETIDSAGQPRTLSRAA
jgi:stage V sporulation protein R